MMKIAPLILPTSHCCHHTNSLPHPAPLPTHLQLQQLVVRAVQAVGVGVQLQQLALQLRQPALQRIKLQRALRAGGGGTGRRGETTNAAAAMTGELCMAP